jgi:hypothetical protein
MRAAPEVSRVPMMRRIAFMKRKGCFPLLAALASAALTGCDSGPTLVPVSGTVTLDGKPLEGANIAFVPDSSNPAPQTQGMDVTGSSGNYKVMYNNRSGIAAGKYKVTISKLEAKPGVVLPEEFKKDPVMAKMAGLVKETMPDSVSGGVGETQFERVVPPEGGTFDFDVKATKDAKSKTR